MEKNETFLEKIKSIVTFKNVSILVLLVVVLVIGISLARNVFTKSETLEENFYQIYNTVKFPFEDGKLLLTEEDVLVYSNDGENETLEETPLYFELSDGFIATTNFTYVNDNDANQSLVAMFSTIKNNDNNETVVVYENKETVLDGGLLYDGNGTYVFLEDVTLTINGENLKLSKYSFVKTYQGSAVVYYDYESDKAFLYENPSTITATDLGFLVDLVNNKLTYNDGVPLILFNDPSLLELVGN